MSDSDLSCLKHVSRTTLRSSLLESLHGSYITSLEGPGVVYFQLGNPEPEIPEPKTLHSVSPAPIIAQNHRPYTF